MSLQVCVVIKPVVKRYRDEKWDRNGGCTSRTYLYIVSGTQDIQFCILQIPKCTASTPAFRRNLLASTVTATNSYYAGKNQLFLFIAKDTRVRSNLLPQPIPKLHQKHFSVHFWYLQRSFALNNSRFSAARRDVSHERFHGEAANRTGTHNLPRYNPQLRRPLSSTEI